MGDIYNGDKYIYTNSNLLIKTIKLIINNSKKKIKKTQKQCDYCNKKFNTSYVWKSKNTKIIIEKYDEHLLKAHNKINSNLYKQISTISLDNLANFKWCLITTNQLNILDGLYEVGSNKIYTGKNKNISQSKVIRFSEHSGFLYVEKNKVSNIAIITDSRVEQSDPSIYMPKNCLEALEVNYIFHTHPKTPYIGSRTKFGIIYEFPSISDIIHFIDHHNNGKLLGSVIVAPEGLYVIRKNNFDRKNISVDYDIMIDELEDIYTICYNDSLIEYSNINYEKHKLNDEIKLPENIFYNKISKNYSYIDKINKVLIKYDIFVDYYARIFFDKTEFTSNKWIFNDIYLPYAN